MLMQFRITEIGIQTPQSGSQQFTNRFC